MANQVVSRTVKGETKKRLSIEGSYIDSLIVGGSAWTKIRLGMRFSVTRNADLTSPPSIYFGLASISGNVVGKPTPKHFLGVKTNATNWTYGNGFTRGAVFSCGISTLIIVGGVETSNAIGIQGGAINNDNKPVLASSVGSSAESDGLLYGFFIEITKGSPNYNIALWTVGSTPTSNTSLATRNIDNQKFKDYMNSVTLPTGTNELVAIGNTDYAVDEITNGTLDTLNVAWQGSAFPIEIANTDVKVLA